MDLTRFFRPDYQSARAAFLVAAQGCGAVLESVSHPEPGPDGQPIATDVAWIGPRDAERVMVVLSGTHGVEGFCGSGAQLHWLLGPGPAALPRGIAALLVHAVNPFGFAWQRRVDHQNIDLNRNFIDWSEPVPHNDPYDALADLLEANDAALFADPNHLATAAARLADALADFDANAESPSKLPTTQLDTATAPRAVRALKTLSANHPTSIQAAYAQLEGPAQAALQKAVC